MELAVIEKIFLLGVDHIWDIFEFCSREVQLLLSQVVKSVP